MSQPLQCHRISAESSDEDVQRVLDLSNQIFQTKPDQSPHSSFEYWRERLSVSKSTVILVATRSQLPTSVKHGDRTEISDSDTANTQQEILGYFFCYPKVQPEMGFEALHLWLAGVLPQFRGLGVFPFLLEELKRQARVDLGLKCLSVCTVPKRFEKMYRILNSTGWEEVAWRDNGEKILMKLDLE